MDNPYFYLKSILHIIYFRINFASENVTERHMRLKIFLAAAAIAFQANCQTMETLWRDFNNPANEARTKLWWFHGEAETTREGIEADLKAFREAGIGGVVFYDQCHGAQEGAFPSLSPQWWEMLKYAARTAKDLGLSFEVACTNGYVAGGPWITPEYGMQEIVVLRPGDPAPANFHKLTDISLPVSNETTFVDTLLQRERVTLENNAPFQLSFDFDTPKEVRSISYMVTPRGKGSYGSMNIPGKPSADYFGAKYVMMPPVGVLEKSDDGKSWTKVCDLRGVEDVIGHKSRQRTLNFPAVKARHFRVCFQDWIGPESNYKKLQVEKVRLMSYDLTSNWEEKSGLRSEVKRETDLPAVTGAFVPFVGKATIGYAPTGGHAKHGRERIIWDGKELKAKTWLEADVLNSEAAKLHYNSYFKAVHDTLASIGCAPTGMHIDSHEAGVANWTHRMPEHFKRLRGYDIERWIPALAGHIIDSREATERFLDDFRLTVSQLVSEQFYAALASLCHADDVSLTSQAMLGCLNDNIVSRGQADKPQGEFWGYQENGNYDVLDAASAAHLFGKSIASGEAFTDSPYFYPASDDDKDWKERGWHNLLRIANLAYTRGINEFVVCASTYQPWIDRKYDDSQSGHPYIFHRHNLAWDKSREHFWEYQARCSQLLQTGRPVVDILVYLGEELPAKTLAYKLPEIPEGFTHDVATLASLRQWMENPSDLSPNYKILAVQDRSVISPETEELFKVLEERGMTIVRCDKGERIGEKTAQAGIEPDLYIQSEDMPDSKVYFTHRSTPESDIYFVYNHSDKTYCSPLKLRNVGKSTELWNPLTAERSEAGDVLTLQPYESTFIITGSGLE